MPSDVRRFIMDGDSYTIDENVDLDTPIARTEPPIEIQGEPWGWTKEGPKPKGFREDGKYDNGRERGDPGPFDGEWERPE